MTLHLHILLWISGAASPKDIRERLLGGDKEFERKLIEYLESVHVGEFLTGTKEEVAARIPADARPKNKGIHTIIESAGPSHPDSYVNPTESMPVPPPSDLCATECEGECPNCAALDTWYGRFQSTVDDLLLRVNVHNCFKRAKTSGPGTPHETAKPCIGKYKKCAARFPRKVVKESHVDAKDGHILLKKLESSINTVTPAVTYTNIANTDTTSLQSGTGIKATVGYICDYLTKSFLKTHQIFSSMYDIF
ncbi:hypothetical protein BKA70DRAFT_1131884, partial [Coprinopsis sp. MPI-PUGE-AT-0042]